MIIDSDLRSFTLRYILKDVSYLYLAFRNVTRNIQSSLEVVDSEGRQTRSYALKLHLSTLYCRPHCPELTRVTAYALPWCLQHKIVCYIRKCLQNILCLSVLQELRSPPALVNSAPMQK